MSTGFLPIGQADLRQRGWDSVDFALITGDAYVDHPSFGAAIISRVLDKAGFKVGIIAQPDWRDLNEFRRFGRPNLAFLINGGNMDSMVNHYTVAKNRRKHDAYSPGGKVGLRPDRATIVYANKAKEAYKDVPIILGGIETSLRRLAHYDYWDNRVRRSILLDAKADLLVYGMGERQILEIAEALAVGVPVSQINYLRGTVYRTFNLEHVYEPMLLHDYDRIVSCKKSYAESFSIQYQNTDPLTGKTLVEPYRDFYVVQNPPAKWLSSDELDDIYRLPFTKRYHPIYESVGGIPALKEVKFSLVSSRGCFGGCSFCALHFHQGRTVQARSIQSLVEEAKALIQEPDFKGYINDVGGPTADFRAPSCQRQLKTGVCAKRHCLGSQPCKNLEVDHRDYLELLRTLRELPGVKKVFVRSGIRYDYVVYDQNPTFLKELCQHHVSGQLKVAPEHVSNKVLDLMGKPKRAVYDRFVQQYEDMNRRLGKKQYLVPYFISSHPGSDLHAAIELAEYIRDMGHSPEQVQDFYPTPGTLSTCMYYTGINPLTGQRVYVPKSPREKAMQRALLQYSKPHNYPLVLEALKQAGREDLIGYGPKSLIRPRKGRVSRRKP
jgi:uncharacterized radical SAM protein YgiQ